MAPPPTAGVSRKPSLFTCALRADDAHVDTSVHVHDGAPQSLEECARRVARDLRVKLLDAVVRGRTTLKPSAPPSAQTATSRAKRERGWETVRARRVGSTLAEVRGDEARDCDDGCHRGDGEGAIARMMAVCKFVMSLCAEILQPAHADIECAASAEAERAMAPPLGTHVIRRISLVDGDDATRSVYFQEQSSFKFETIRTADHFIDGAHQCVYASCKVQTLPRVSSSGAVITIHLDAPPPMTMHESMKDDVREGCFVELLGASGHPDYLRRVKNHDGDVEEGEIYEFNLPSLRVSGLARGYPIGELEGEVRVTCKSTGLVTNIKFRPFDVETSPAFRNIVSGTMSFTNADVQRLILGTWDTRVLCGRIPNEGAKVDDMNEILFDAHDFDVAPLTTATGVKSLKHAICSPAYMCNKRLWQSIVEALRVAELNEPERSIVDEWIGQAPSAVKEKVDENIRMGYEMAAIVADSPSDDAPPPLPRFWFPASKTEE